MCLYSDSGTCAFERRSTVHGIRSETNILLVCDMERHSKQISLPRIFVWRTWSVPSCTQVNMGRCFIGTHFFSSCWPDSSTNMSMLVLSFGRSTSETTPFSTVVDEHAILSDVCASKRWRTACTVPYKIFDICSLGRIFVRNIYTK